MKLRVAEIGMGGISGAHIPAWEAMEDAELVAICDIRTERMEKYDPSSVVNADSLYRDLGITQGDLEAIGEVEFE